MKCKVVGLSELLVGPKRPLFVSYSKILCCVLDHPTQTISLFGIHSEDSFDS